MIKNNVRYNHGDTNIPKHWALSTIHQIDVKNIMKNHYKLLFELYEDSDLIDFIQRLQPKLYNLLLLASNIPKLATIDNMRYCFDAEICNLLHQHFILLVFDKFINYIDEDYVIKESKIIAPLSTETFEEKDNGDISQIEILIGEKKTNSEKVSNLLIIFINTYLQSYSSTIYDYPDVMEKVLRSKEKEKEQFTTYLKELSEDERKVQDIMKKQQLEKWGKGLQKGLIQYDKDTYDEERENLEKVAIMERKLEKNDMVTDMNKDIYMLESMTQDEIARDIENEEYDMSYMHNDDDYDDDMEELALQLGAIRDNDD
jgi:hypothetical protein